MMRTSMFGPSSYGAFFLHFSCRTLLQRNLVATARAIRVICRDLLWLGTLTWITLRKHDYRSNWTTTITGAVTAKINDTWWISHLCLITKRFSCQFEPGCVSLRVQPDFSQIRLWTFAASLPVVTALLGFSTASVRSRISPQTKRFSLTWRSHKEKLMNYNSMTFGCYCSRWRASHNHTLFTCIVYPDLTIKASPPVSGWQTQQSFMRFKWY